MEQVVSAADANRGFSRDLREVQGGSTYVVTAHGRPVARIVPFQAQQTERAAAWDALMVHLENQLTTDIGPWSRDELYDE